METAFWFGDKQYVVETATQEEKSELKEKNPELYSRYFPEVVEETEAEKPVKRVKP